MTRLHILFQHGMDQLPNGCSLIRLLRPLNYPGLALPWQVSAGTDLPSQPADIVIIERLWKPGTDVESADALMRTLREAGSTVLFTLDDDLLALPLSAGQANAVRLFARRADGIIVSTDPLGERMRRLNPRVRVVPNQLDDTLFGGPTPPKPAGDTVVMGYMGTPTHLHDLLSILAPLRAVMRRHAPRLQLELVGVASNPYVAELFEGLPVRFKTPEGHVAYDRFVPWMRRELHWDFAIAPLLDTPFNTSKSDLKYLDYGALSIPGVFSAVRPYLDTVADGDTGLIAHNQDDWARHIETLATDAAARERLAIRARDHVHNERMLRTHAADWVDAIEQLRTA